MISVQYISKTYDDVVALADFSHDFLPGTTTALIGPSGCGKSTLLRVLVGLVSPDKGQISIEGEPLDDESIQSLRTRIGYVIQRGGLFPHMTAYENVSLLQKQQNRSDEQIADRIKYLANVVHLSSRQLTHFPSQLSGGQRQRVSIMRALMHDPKVLLLDEPLGALDSIVRSELQRDLKEIFESLGKTVILVTHDLAEAAFFTNTMLLMKSGSIVETGSLKSLYASENPFVESFVNAQHLTAQTFISNL